MPVPLARFARQLPLALLSPVFVLVALPALWLTDVFWKIFGPRRRPADTRPDTTGASVVIPNWNGKHLLEQYLPSVVEGMAGNPRNEVIVVDNGSADGSAEFLRQAFPTVRCLALPENLGFGGGSNTGFRAAKNDIVVLLNSDMRVDRGFLQPLLDGFSNEKVFAVSCQIFFSDPAKRREETGLTQAWWNHGGLRVRHYEDPDVDRPFPCFYGGGGSCAFDRRKFLELGGFDHVLKPFYLEDTDLGYMAWKRGWQVLYQPHSKVWHEHQGTIGRKFSRAYIESIVNKNFLLFAWKNIHEPGCLAGHFFHAWAGALISLFAGESRERASLSGLLRAFVQLPGAMAARWRARSLAVVDDSEAFRRTMGGYFRDRFAALPANPDRLNVLFVSPYPICPPIHGGGVFMYETVKQLGGLTNLHVLAMVDRPKERQAHAALVPYTRSIEFVIRSEGHPKGVGAITPFAVREFYDQELEWLIHRQIFLKEIDVVQVEYTNMAQYAGPYRQIAWTLFEHDVYFQSIGRTMRGFGAVARAKAFTEYLRAMRYELDVLPRLDEIQTCTRENTDYLLSFLPELKDRIHHHLRAGIDTSGYDYNPAAVRQPKTMLFLGSFRHLPNKHALNWLLGEVMPHVLAQEPDARLMVIGADPPAAHTIPDYGGAVKMIGFVENIRQPLADYSVFVCPILSGSGVRVKLLEAFASGIPAVSTRVGAEGLGEEDGRYCRLADDPREFAAKVVELFRDPAAAAQMAARAREFVTAERDIAGMTRSLEQTYRAALANKRKN